MSIAEMGIKNIDNWSFQIRESNTNNKLGSHTKKLGKFMEKCVLTSEVGQIEIDDLDLDNQNNTETGDMNPTKAQVRAYSKITKFDKVLTRR